VIGTRSRQLKIGFPGTGIFRAWKAIIGLEIIALRSFGVLRVSALIGELGIDHDARKGFIAVRHALPCPFCPLTSHALRRCVLLETRHLDAAGAPLGLPEIILQLQTQPGLGIAPEGLGQADRHFRRYAAMPVYQLGQRLARDAEPFGRRRDRQTKRFKALLAYDSAGVRRVVHLHRFIPFRLSVVIEQIDVCGLLALELEYDPQITRYGHSPLSFALAFQGWSRNPGRFMSVGSWLTFKKARIC